MTDNEKLVSIDTIIAGGAEKPYIQQCFNQHNQYFRLLAIGIVTVANKVESIIKE